MGCASSSNPLEAAKKAAGDMMDAGEKAMSDVGDTVGDTMDDMVESVNNVGKGITDAIKSGKDKIKEKFDDDDDEDVKTLDEDEDHSLNEEDERIPLHTSEEMENMKNKMLNKMGSLGSEADDMTDELMKDTEMAMHEMDDEVMTIVQETSDLANHETMDVMDAMKNEIMSNQADDMMVEDIEGSNDSTQEMTDTTADNDKRKTSQSTGGAWGGTTNFRHFASVVTSSVKQDADDAYVPTAWELLADQILQSKVKTKFSKPDEDEIKKKQEEQEEQKTLSITDRMEIAQMSDRERALCYK